MEWVDVRKRIETGENYHTEFKRAATNLNADAARRSRNCRAAAPRQGCAGLAFGAQKAIH